MHEKVLICSNGELPRAEARVGRGRNALGITDGLFVPVIDPGETTRKLLISEANVLERVSEDTRRYALKHDGVRRFLATAEELTAARRALLSVAGHRNVNGLRRPT